MPKKRSIPKVSLISDSEAETMSCAKRLARQLKRGDIVFLQGELGAGKTTFVKGLAQAFKVDPKKVNSPTFVLMNQYRGEVAIYHFDLYRLANPKELDSVDFDEYFYGKGISLIEWPQRLNDHKPERFYLVEFQQKARLPHQRKITITRVEAV